MNTIPDRSMHFDILGSADFRKAEQTVRNFAREMNRRITQAVNALPDIEIDAKSTGVDRRIAEIRKELEALSDKRVGVDIDATAARAEMRRLQSELRQLGSQSESIQVRADTAAAAAALGNLDRQAKRLDGQTVQMTARVNGDRALTVIGLITAGLATMGALAPVAGAAVAAGVAGAGAAAQGLGALAAGFSGVGDAVKALSEEEAKGAAASSAAGASRVATAQRVAAAQRTLDQARVQSQRAAITGAQQVADAERSAADAIEQAADNVVTARQRLVDAGTAVVRAEADLHEARQQAIRDLQDLSEQVSDNALTIEGAEISLLRAQERQAKVNADAVSSDLDRREAALGVAEAQDRLADAHTRAGRDQDELNDAERRGVNASRDVLAARFRLNDANRDHRAALDGMREAQEAHTRAQQDGARDIARAQQQAAWAQQDAARQVVDAQQQLAAAMVETGTAGSAAADKVAEAMAGLSPAGQQFARFLHGEMLPALRAVRDEVQATTLPRMETALRNMLPVIPLFADGLAESGRVMGDLTVRGSRMMSSGPWQRDFATIMASNNRSLETFGMTGLGVADSWRHLAVTGGPLVERLAAATLRGSELANQWLATKRSTGELDQFMTAAGDTLLEIAQTLGQVAMGAGQVAVALGPVGGVLLDVVGNLAEMIGNFAEAHPTITAWIGGLTLATITVAKLGTTITGLVASGAAARMGIGHLTSALSLIVPVNAQSKLASMAGLIDASGNATERAATRAGGFVGSLSRVVSYIPAVGLAVGGAALAYDGLTMSVGEAQDKIAQGGQAANQTVAELLKSTQVIREHSFGWDWLAKVAGKIRPGFEEVQAVTHGVAGAQMNLNAAMLQHPPTSEQVRFAQQQLVVATREEEIQQRMAADGVDRHTAALRVQADQMFESANADLAMRESTLAVAEAQRNLSQATTQYGATSLEAERASVIYEQALLRNITAIGENARHQASLRGESDLAGAAINAQRQAVQTLIAEAGGNAPPALQAMVDALNHTGRQAWSATQNVAGLNQRVHELPPAKDIAIRAHTAGAQAQIDRFISANDQRVIRMEVQAGMGNIMAGARPRATGGVDTPAWMQAGGVRSMRRDIAQTVPPNQPVIMGDRMRGREYFLPDDNSPRSLAVGQQWAADRGLRLVPMAVGGVLSMQAGGVTQVQHGSVAPEVWDRLLGMGYRGDPADRMEALYVPADVLRSVQSYQSALGDLAARGVTPLAQQLNNLFTPALERARQLAGTEAVTAIQALTGALLPLTEATVVSGQTMQLTWGANTAAVTTAQAMQTGQYALLATNLATYTAGMTGSMWSMQAQHNASWSDMRARAGTEAATITGPIFSGLHGGLRGVADHATRTADWWGGQLGRIRALTADPIRWALDFPINRGLVPAWGEIDRFFALGRPWGGVPVGFAHGTEDHRAVIAHGAQPRVWNEPETGGEAYIPLAPSKRDRSTGILTDVAHRFGYALEPENFADGGLWRQMFGIVRNQFPGARLTSAYRPGDSGYHGTGRATDLAGPMAAINRWLAEKFANSTQLIYTPGINLFRGRPHTYNAATRADHYDHVHWAMEHAGMLGGQQGHYAGGVGGFDPTAVIEEKLAHTRRMIADIHRFHGAGGLPTAMTRVGNDAVAGAVTKATELAMTAGPGPGGGVERWRPVVHRALAMTGQSRMHDNTTLRRMNQESGGNPRAINNYDINAQRGDPSKGLMQVIGCVPLTTRILTQRGWLTHVEVRVGDVTLGYNPETDRNEWTLVRQVVHYQDRRVWRIGNGWWHADVTGEHRWWSDTRRKVPVPPEVFCLRCSRSFKSPRGYQVHMNKVHHVSRPKATTLHVGEFVRTTDLNGSHRLRLAAVADTDGIVGLSLEEVRILAWLRGDGHIRVAEQSHLGYDGTIFQSKPHMVLKIRALLAAVPHTERTRERGGNTQPAHEFRLRRAYVTDLVKRSEMLEHGDEAFVLRLSPDQRAAWLDAMIDAEGNRQSDPKGPEWNDFIRITQRDSSLQDAIKLAVYLEGWRPSVSRLGRYSDRHAPAANIGLCRPHVAPSMFHEARDLGLCDVWCIETDLGTWTMEQDGQIMLTGNSTFRAHRHPQTVNDIWDPLANVAASMRYALARYGSLPAAYNRKGGYDWGGDWPPNTWGYNGSGGTEHVLRAPERDAFLRLVEVLTTHRGMPRPVPAMTPPMTPLGTPAQREDTRSFATVVANATARAVSDALAGPGLEAKLVDDGRNGIFWIHRRQARAVGRT